jgi:hypothetical protein
LPREKDEDEKEEKEEKKKKESFLQSGVYFGTPILPIPTGQTRRPSRRYI